MLMRCLVTVCALLLVWCADSQSLPGENHLVEERHIEANLRSGVTVVSLPIHGLSRTYAGHIQLEWLDPDGKSNQSKLQDILIPPEGTIFDALLPLPVKQPILARLRYRLTPAAANLLAFPDQTGVVAFTEVASYAYMLSVTASFPDRPGQPIDVHVIATNPKTNMPVPNVEVSLGPVRARTGADGSAALRVRPTQLRELNEARVKASLGGLTQEAEIDLGSQPSASIKLSTDKNLYRPGQTLHMRLLLLSNEGTAASGQSCSLAITDQQNDTVFAVNLTTSRFGIVHGDWEIPSHSRSGEFHVKADCNDADSAVAIQVRQYELPSFRVLADPDRPFYLKGERRKVTVQAEYLFGKALTVGHVRIAEFQEDLPLSTGGKKSAKIEGASPALLEGDLDSKGRFVADLTPDANKTGDAAKPDFTKQFEDLHFVASVTDPTTNRTEQMRFDMRLSAQALHIYLPHVSRPSPLGVPVFLTVFSPDGQPVISDVEVLSGQRIVQTARTNRFGIAKAIIHPADGITSVRARRGTASASIPWQDPDENGNGDYGGLNEAAAPLRIETGRALFAPGQSIEATIRSVKVLPPGQILLWKGSELLLSRTLNPTATETQVSLAYDPRFSGLLTIGYACRLGTVAHAIVFPEPNPLHISVRQAASTSSTKFSYRPGETASLFLSARDSRGKPVDAAFGVSIVDVAVMQRAKADGQFSRPLNWNSGQPQNETRYAGLTIEDLPLLDPRKVDADIQLAAEALLQGSGLTAQHASLPEMLVEAFGRGTNVGGAIAISEQIYNQHSATFRFPHSELDLNGMVPTWSSMRDPWDRPYRPTFGAEGSDFVIHWHSAGPDHQFDTSDDLILTTTRVGWFVPYRELISNAFESVTDLPSSAEDATALLAAQGIAVANLRDPWRIPLRLRISYAQAARVLRVESAGPDRKFDTNDDVVVEESVGTWFRETRRKLDKSIGAASNFPRTENEFFQDASVAGIDFGRLRDPWGHPYTVHFSESNRYEDRVRIFTEAEFNSAARGKHSTEPITVHVRQIEIRSAGEDGVAGTYDDAIVATFETILERPIINSPSVETAPVSPAHVAGTGTLTGTVADPAGGAIPNVTVTTDDLYATKSDADGLYRLLSVPPGLHRLTFESAGFQTFYLSRVPVETGSVTKADALLQVGAVSQTVEVAAAPVPLQTSSSELALSKFGTAITAPVETLRVRNYFAETLLWAPELITDKNGSVQLPVKLADNITTWKAAITASTVDGRIAENSTELSAFMPFFADLDPPPVLTVSDEVDVPIVVRNYTNSRQNVSLDITTAPQITMLRVPAKQQSIGPQATDSFPLGLRAVAPTEAAQVRVRARSQKLGDAVERPIAIHPDGRFFERTSNDSLNNPNLQLDVPSNVIRGTLHSELKLYPSVLATLVESIKSMLQAPHGCAEQIISSAYPNLLLLQLIDQAHLTEPKLKAAALKNLKDGYAGLLSYRDAGGGFSYWIGQKPDLALTAYGVQFLREASQFITVEQKVISGAQDWMRNQTPEDTTLASLRISTLVALGSKGQADVLAQLSHLAREAQQSDDPYAMATFALSAMDAGHFEVAQTTVQQLLASAAKEEGLIYWAVRKNTPFYGYGDAGRIETTAVVVDALQQWKTRGHTNGSEAAAIDAAINQALLFVIRHRGSHSYWYSTQPTIRVLRALVHGVDLKSAELPFDATILVNGVSVAAVAIPGGVKLSGPVVVDVSKDLRIGMANQVKIVAPDGHSLVQTQLAMSWYEPWAGDVHSKELAIQAHYSTLTPESNGLVRFEVIADRPNFRGFGMIIAEVGLPPGAEVDRAALAQLSIDGLIDQFEIEPDRVRFYLWPRAGEMKFSFFFRPRFVMSARTASTQVFDYYNPEIRAIQVPVMFSVR